MGQSAVTMLDRFEMTVLSNKSSRGDIFLLVVYFIVSINCILYQLVDQGLRKMNPMHKTTDELSGELVHLS